MLARCDPLNKAILHGAVYLRTDNNPGQARMALEEVDGEAVVET